METIDLQGFGFLSSAGAARQVAYLRNKPHPLFGTKGLLRLRFSICQTIKPEMGWRKPAAAS